MKNRLWIVAAVVMALAPAGLADVKLSEIFSDHAVLQRDMKVPVWGLAQPGEKVSVKFNGQNVSATAGQDGKWVAHLEPMKAGGPFEMVIAGRNTITLKDLMVGEVWLCAGQSNMGTSLQGGYLGSEWKQPPQPNLRLIDIGGQGNFTAGEPQQVSPSVWLVAEGETVLRYSAIGYYFAKAIQ